MDDKILTIILSAIVAIITNLLLEPVKLFFQRNSNKLVLKDNNKIKYDIELFNTLNRIMEEGILKGTMEVIKDNQEYYYEFIAQSGQYQLYVESFEGAKFINKKIETAHKTFIYSLKEVTDFLSIDFEFKGNGTYRPRSEKSKEYIKNKWNPKVEQVLRNYSDYRSLIKNEYHI